MDKFNDLFPNVFVINVDSLTDRFKEISSHLSEKDITFERIQGVVPNEGKTRADRDAGCFFSHRKCVEIANQRKYENILVLEDDAYFDPDYDILKNIEDIAAFMYTADWHLLYLGGNHERTPEKTEYKGIVKVSLTKTTHAVCYNKSSYNIYLNTAYSNIPVDDFAIRTFQTRGYSFCTTPRYLSQRAGQSYILDGYRDNNYCLKGE